MKQGRLRAIEHALSNILRRARSFLLTKRWGSGRGPGRATAARAVRPTCAAGSAAGVTRK